MPNYLAYFVFFLWPLYVKKILKQHPIQHAIFVCFTISLLLLPSSLVVDPPFVPPLDKTSITCIALMLFLSIGRNRFKYFASGAITKLVILYFIVVLISTLLNQDPYMNGSVFMQGTSLYDALSFIIDSFLYLSPFLMGRFYFIHTNDTEKIYQFWVKAALIYSLPMLLEVKISPQLQYLVYGFSAGDFLQQIRDGGYRPMVFYGHGLGLAFWLSTTLIAFFAMVKTKNRVLGLPGFMVVIFFLGVLFLSKTWSAIFYTLCGAALIVCFKPEKQINIAFLAAIIIMCYPLSKIANIFPQDELLQTIGSYSAERAQSMQVRFENEDRILAHALERPWFGWSGYNRGEVYDEWGKDITVIDGKWVGVLSVYGFMGFLMFYLILLYPLLLAKRAIKLIDDDRQKIYFASLAVILLICILDSIPNTGMRSVHFFLAGGLLAQSEALINIKKNKIKSLK